jgi:superfamily II DNA/RNA helicase
MHLSIGEAPTGAEGGATTATRPRDAQGPTEPAASGPATPTAVTFADFGLDPAILRAVSELGYREPTPIQVQAIPVVMAGKDVMGAAQTGTGKTAGFALPIIHKLLPLASSSTSPARHPVRALIIAPTRELADQIHENVKAYSRHTPLRSAVVFGGVDMKPQTAALRAGVEILTATPGRLLDHVEQKSANLSQVQLLVLDEADRMLDMGFLPDIQRIINLLAPQRQSLMFSATFSPEIRKLARTFLKEPQLIEVARRNALADNVEQTVYRVDGDEAKRVAVASLIRDRGLDQVIVFSNTKIGAGRLARQLQKEGLKAEAIHGDKSQQERLQTLEAFKQGEIKVLVATDVAARGLDIVELPAVINFDLPHSPEDYIHRIGRTGRAGASGMALSLMVEKDQRALADIEKLTQRKLNVEALAVSLPGRREAGRESSPDAYRDGSREKRGREAGGGRRDSAPDRERTAPARRNASAPSRAAKTDPFFSRPYEPAPEAGEEVTAEPVARNGLRRPARKVAALLGGKPGPA